MKHRNHMIPCLIVAALAVVLIATGSLPFGAGIGLVLLLCPLLMGTMMWLLMRQPAAPSAHSDQHRPDSLDEPQPLSRTPHS